MGSAAIRLDTYCCVHVAYYRYGWQKCNFFVAEASRRRSLGGYPQKKREKGWLLGTFGRPFSVS